MLHLCIARYSPKDYLSCPLFFPRKAFYDPSPLFPLTPPNVVNYFYHLLLLVKIYVLIMN